MAKKKWMKIVKSQTRVWRDRPILLSTRLAVYYYAFRLSAGQSLKSTAHSHNTITYTHNATINIASYGNPIRETFNLFIRSLYRTGGRKLQLFFWRPYAGKRNARPGKFARCTERFTRHSKIISIEKKICFLNCFQYFFSLIRPFCQSINGNDFQNLAAKSDHLFLPFTSII